MFDLFAALAKLLKQENATPPAQGIRGNRTSSHIGGRMPVLAEKARDKKKTRRLMAEKSRRINRARL